MSTIPFPTPPVHRPPVISRRTMLTVSAAAGLSGLAAGYVTLTRPLLRPTGAAEGRPAFKAAPDLATLENDLARRYLPDQPWAADAKYVVRNGRSVLFFNEWPRTADGKAVELKPFAMVFPPKEEQEDDTPLVIVGDSAIVQLEGAIDKLETADPGRIIGGRMPGLVEVRGPDGLKLLGQNFHFNESPEPLIWSDEGVAFNQGPHSGRGTGVTIELFRVGDTTAFESVAVNGVRKVRIRKDVQMDLRTGRGEGPFASLSGEAAKQDAAAENEESPPTQVTCSGAFTFDCRTNQVSFERNVVAARGAREGGPPDTLECDLLTIVFEPKTEEGKAAHAARWAKVDGGTLVEDDGFQAPDGELDITLLDASGEKTVLRSPSNEFAAEMTRLVYDAARGVTTLMRDDAPVIARQATSLLASPKIVIEPSPGGGPARIACLGQGWLKHEDAPGQLALQAIWTESLHRSRGGDGLDQIRLTGAAEVSQPRENFVLRADQIDLWMKPNEDGDAEVSRPAGPSLVGSGRMEPVRLLAEKTSADKVKLRSPELWADSNRLEVTFAEPTPAATAALESRSRLIPVSRQIRLVSAEESSPQAPAIAGPEANTAAPAVQTAEGSPAVATTEPPSSKPVNPIILDTDKISVVVDRSAEQEVAAETEETNPARGGQVREVHTTGGVVVVQKRDDGKEPLYIEGDRLDLFNRGKDRELVHIYGTPGPNGGTAGEKPARVHDQGSDLRGMNINLDRAENVAWVEGKGVLQLPVKDAGGLLGTSEEGETPEDELRLEEPAQPQQLRVWWQERMRFDGEKAVFFGTVQTQFDGNVMACEEMEIRLTERFDFAAAGRDDSSESATRPEVSEVLCKHRVLVYGAERDETGKHIGDRQARFFEFRLDQRTGDTFAHGPGEILVWRKGSGNRAGLASDNAVRANSIARRDDQAWEFLRVRFQGTSEGNIHRKSTTFERDVEVVYGPVPDTGRLIDPNRPDQAPVEAGWMTSERLTLTRHDKTATTPAYSEVEAEGNVKLDGRGFSGMADQVTYDESKGQYILRSFGKNMATIAKVSGDDGRGAGQAEGQEIQFYPARGKVNVTRSKGADGVQ